MPPGRGGDGQLGAATALIRKRAARTEDDDDDLVPASGGDGQLNAPHVPRRKRAATNDDDDDVCPTRDDDGQLVTLSAVSRPTSLDDDDDVSPTCSGDGQLVVSPFLLRKRAARVDDDDDDIAPTSGGDGEIMPAPVHRGRGKSGSVTADLDDECNMSAKYKKGEEHLRQALAKLQEAEERLKQSELELMLCEADENSLGVLLSESTESSRRQGPPSLGPATEALREERLLRARQHLGTEQARRQMASTVAKARLETATARLHEADTETVAATQAEKEAADASANAWAQVHLARVRKSKVRQRAEAEASAVKQRKEEEARLTQARARMEEAQAHLQHLELELALCESDERALDRLLSKGSTEPARMESERTLSPSMGGGDRELMARSSPSVRLVSGSKSGSTAADEMSLDAYDAGAGIDRFGRGVAKEGSNRSGSTEAMQSERLARARGQLGAERARREVALAQAETQREAASAAARARLEVAAAQLVEAEAEAAAATQEEKEAADASRSAWAQVHMDRVRSSPRVMVGQRAEADAKAHTAQEHVQEGTRMQQARAKLEGAQERLRQTERELTLCKTEEASLGEAEDRAFKASDGTDPQPPRQLGPSSVSPEEIVLETNSSDPGPHVDPVLRLEMEARSRLAAKKFKEAKREERLRRARERLGAERGRREKTEAEANAQLVSKARDGASKLGWSPVALRSPTEIVRGLGPVQRITSPMHPRSSPRSTSSPSTSSPLRPPPMVRKDGEVWSTAEAQAASPKITITPAALAAQRWLSNAMQPPHNKPRSTLSLMGSMGGSRHRVAVVPSLVSCTHEPSDRRGSASSVGGGAEIFSHRSGETLGIPASSLAAQRWLSTAIGQLSSRQESEAREDDDVNQTTTLARI